MYFAVGGRNTQSGLYRVTYDGPEPTAEAVPAEGTATFEARGLRHELERFHGRREPKAVEAAWPYLGHPDRFIRWAARVADRGAGPGALARSGARRVVQPRRDAQRPAGPDPRLGPGPGPPRPGDPAPDPALRDRILAALDRSTGTRSTRAAGSTCCASTRSSCNRFGRPDDATVARLIGRLDPHYPGAEPRAERRAGPGARLPPGPRRRGQDRRPAGAGARPSRSRSSTPATCGCSRPAGPPSCGKAYFSWFPRAADVQGRQQLPRIHGEHPPRRDGQPQRGRQGRLKPILEARPAPAARSAADPSGSSSRSGRSTSWCRWSSRASRAATTTAATTMFAAAKCFSCHRFNNEGGGLGPDLSGVAGRFSVRDLLESVVVPSKTISDQYQAVVIATTDGQVVTGRIVNLHGNNLMICPDMLDPGRMINVQRDEIEEMKASPVSLMPEGLLDTLDRDEVLDLIAYLLSRGDRNDPMFKRGGVRGGALTPIVASTRGLEGGRTSRRANRLGRSLPARSLRRLADPPHVETIHDRAAGVPDLARPTGGPARNRRRPAIRGAGDRRRRAESGGGPGVRRPGRRAGCRDRADPDGQRSRSRTPRTWSGSSRRSPRSSACRK